MGLLLLDLDGTLIDNALVEVDGKLQRHQHELYTEPTLLPNRYERLKQSADEGDSFAIVTNQGGVAWGYHTQAEVYARIAATLRQLCFFWGRPFSVHVAFMHPRATVPQFKGDDGRKPSPFMIGEALGCHQAPAAPVLMIGDRDEDREAAESAQVDFVHADDFFA